jgi:hypothetical protein
VCPGKQKSTLQRSWRLSLYMFIAGIDERCNNHLIDVSTASQFESVGYLSLRIKTKVDVSFQLNGLIK